MIDWLDRLLAKIRSYNDFPLFLIVPCSAILFLRELDSNPLFMWDESLYANVVHQMVTEGYWVVPHWNTPGAYGLTTFLEKTPIVFWLQAVSAHIFDDIEFAVRVPSALAAVLCTIVVYSLAQEAYDRRTAIAASLVFLVIPPVSVGKHSGRSGDMDMLLLFFGSLFILLLLRYDGDIKTLYYISFAGALAVFTKGFNAGIFLLVALPVIIRKRNIIFNRHLLISATTSLGIVAVWFFAVYIEHPGVVSVIVGPLERASGSGTIGDPAFSFMSYPYFDRLPIYFWPFGSAVLLSTICAGVNYLYTRDSAQLFLLWWIVFVPAFFIFTGNHIHYVLPMVIPACIFIGFVSSRVWELLQQREVVGINYTMTQYLIIGLIITVGIHAMIPAGDYGSSWDKAQYEMAQNIDIPEGTPIYLEDGSTRANTPNPVWVFEFYTDGDVTVRSSKNIQNNHEMKYILASNATIDSFDKNYDILAASSERDVSLIKMNDTESQ